MKLSIGSDHAGFELKTIIVDLLKSLNHEVSDQGTYSNDRADYPDFAHKVAQEVLTQKAELGILICGSGNGINMSANKHKDIRSALCWSAEIASLARQHNNANIIALPARFISEDIARDCVKAFLEAQFEGGRHQNRVEKINY